MGDILEKGLRRFIYGSSQLAKFVDPLVSALSFEQAVDFLKNKTPLIELVKEYAEKSAGDRLTDEVAAAVADEIINQVLGGQKVRQVSGDEGEWHKPGTQGFDDALSQMHAPTGGTENLTNVASPGQHPGKVSAKPGHSGNYGQPNAKPIDEPKWYDSTGEYSEVPKEVKNPPSHLDTIATREDYASRQHYDSEPGPHTEGYRGTTQPGQASTTYKGGMRYIGNTIPDEETRYSNNPTFKIRAPPIPATYDLRKEMARASLLAGIPDFQKHHDEDEEEDEELRQRAMEELGYSNEELEAMRMDERARYLDEAGYTSQAADYRAAAKAIRTRARMNKGNATVVKRGGTRLLK